MNYALLLAAGNGTRFGKSDMPKQFLDLKNKPVLLHCLEQFLICPQIDKIIVVAPDEWIPHTRDIIFTRYMNNDKIFVTAGGQSRNESLIAAIDFIKQSFKLSSEDLIITHDAVRPFVTYAMIMNTIEKMDSADAVSVSYPVTDTIVNLGKTGFVESMPCRETLHNLQTPQTFRAAEFYELYSALDKENKDKLTDATGVYFYSGKKVGLVDGEKYNMKITAPYDLKLAEAVISVHEND